MSVTQQHRQHGSRGSKHSGACGKSKQHANHPGHSHVASIVHFALNIALPVPTTHTITHVGSSDISTHVIVQDKAKSQVPGVYPSLNKALNLAEHLNIPVIMQTVKWLEQCFTNFNNEVHNKSTSNWDEDYDSDIDVKMSCEAPHCEDPQTVSELEDSNDGGVSPSLSAFEYLAVENYNPYNYNPFAGIHALTPEYINPNNLATEPIGLMDAEIEEAEVTTAMWKDMTKGSLCKQTSNEVVKEVYKKHQEFM